MQGIADPVVTEARGRCAVTAGAAISQEHIAEHVQEVYCPRIYGYVSKVCGLARIQMVISSNQGYPIASDESKRCTHIRCRPHLRC